MKNTIDLLIDELAVVEAQTNGIPELVEHGMASRLLTLALGYAWYERHVKFRSEDPDDWMLNCDDAWLAANPIVNDVRRVVHTHRVIRLADTFFTLLSRQAKGVDTMKDRFLTRQTKPCFIEAEIASLLVCNGFDLEIVKETGVRGGDFDLLAIKDRTTVSVEVTSKIDGPLTAQTVKNTLHSKRDQVPPDRPAVLYMHIPAEWMRPEANGMDVFTKAIVDFVKGSRRFNAIVLIWEEVVPFLMGGFPSVSMRACFSERPRHPFKPRELFEMQSRTAFSLLEALKARRMRVQEAN